MVALLSVAILLSALQPAFGIHVYLNPPRTLSRLSLSPADASAVLSRHFGLESFEPFRDNSAGNYEEDAFVGQGVTNSYLVTVEEDDAEAILPASLRPSFKLSSPPVSSLYSVISTYLNRAKHAYVSIFDASPSLAHYKNTQFLTTFLNEAEDSEFSALDLSGLAEVRKTYGSSSDEFIQAATTVREFIQQRMEESCNLAILTYTPLPTIHYSKRQATESQVPFPDHPPPQEPIGSVSTCFESADVCGNSTDSCSGHGQCLQAEKAGKTCFVCACGASKTGEGNKVKTEYWVGEACERKDISSSFVLLVGSVLVILFVIVGSISLLASAGAEELPSTLLGGAVNSKKD